MKKRILMLLLLVTLLGFIGDSSIPVSDVDNPIAVPIISLVASPPMHITSDADFETLGWSGDGSLGTPYSIDNLEFSNLLDGACITIENTRAYFIITYCEFSAGELGYAIKMNNVTNGLIEFCTTGANAYYIYGNASSHMLLNGLTLASTCIIFEQSHQIEIYHSTISAAPGDGVYFEDCYQMTAYDVTISTCAGYGISYHNTVQSIIWMNIISDSALEQIYISGTSSTNYIYDNIIYVGATGVRDDGSNNIWDNNADKGNWWSDYPGTGTYSISGSAGSVDRYPRGPSTSSSTTTTTTTSTPTTTITTTTATTTTTTTPVGGLVLVTNWIPMDPTIRVVLSLSIGMSYGALVILAIRYFRRK